MWLKELPEFLFCGLHNFIITSRESALTNSRGYFSFTTSAGATRGGETCWGERLKTLFLGGETLPLLLGLLGMNQKNVIDSA